MNKLSLILLLTGLQAMSQDRYAICRGATQLGNKAPEVYTIEISRAQDTEESVHLNITWNNADMSDQYMTTARINKTHNIDRIESEIIINNTNEDLSLFLREETLKLRPQNYEGIFFASIRGFLRISSFNGVKHIQVSCDLF